MLFVVEQEAATCVFHIWFYFLLPLQKIVFVASENTRVETFIIISQAEA